MSDIAVKIENLSKLYHIGEAASGSLAETISGKFKKVFRTTARQNDPTEFWALKDVSFEIKRGEVVGVIGKNGAGKSTLLKILSRITEPTTGKIEINGRVGSLLEVGTGFHPELTGRENIYLNGAILGMARAEIKSKFDEIVDFSGIEKFIDTPVKRYSSGMYVRLAFSVAAHLEPEILIIDEVLAVGDAEFQKKSLGKMQDVAGHGRTVIFVSHNMSAVKKLCSKGIVLINGSLSYAGTSEEAANYYFSNNNALHLVSIKNRKDIKGDQSILVENIEILNNRNNPVGELIVGESCKIKFSFSLREEIQMEKLFFAIQIYDINEKLQTTIASDELGINFPDLAKNGQFVIEIDRLNLRAGDYYINYMISKKVSNATPHVIINHLQHAKAFHVMTSDFYNSGVLLRSAGYLQDARIYTER
ncbi:MAG: ABC transporter ATP-binding protein [Bacteroidetes bacterium]|nr:ABC transporter ATP-binding protein [Bacteroidota bacterium]